MTEEMFSELVKGNLDLILQEIEGKTERRSRTLNHGNNRWMGARATLKHLQDIRSGRPNEII